MFSWCSRGLNWMYISVMDCCNQLIFSAYTCQICTISFTLLYYYRVWRFCLLNTSAVFKQNYSTTMCEKNQFFEQNACYNVLTSCDVKKWTNGLQTFSQVICKFIAIKAKNIIIENCIPFGCIICCKYVQTYVFRYSTALK